MYSLIVIEDETEIRNGLVELIPWAEIGFDVAASFSGGNEAIHWLREHHVHLIITDIIMENGSGIDVAEMIKTEQRSEMVMFYSAYRDFRYAQLGIEYGVKRYITKDMGYHELLEMFREAKHDLDVLYRVPTVGTEEEGFREGSHIVGTLMLYLKKHYRSATLNSAADVVHMNPTYLSTYIKKHLGKNFKEILAGIRMKKAKELLQDPSLTMAEVRDMVGYTDERTFGRAFKSQYGMMPGEYRKKHGGRLS